MHRSLFRRAVPLAAAAALVAVACQDEATTEAANGGPLASTDGVQIQYGSPLQVGNGRARAYVSIDQKTGQPLELGVAFDSTAMYGLPAPSAGHPGGHGDMHEYLLPLPPKAPAPYKVLELDWNPQGHGEPYLAAHFDFHFYTISLEERNAIVPTDPQWAQKAANLAPAEYQRPGFLCPCDVLGIPAGDISVPRMGNHLVDFASPEFHGAPFTATYITGSWDGKIIFQEPMITRDFIMATADQSFDLPLPQRASPAGYYPAGYRVSYDKQAREYRVAISKLTYLQ